MYIITHPFLIRKPSMDTTHPLHPLCQKNEIQLMHEKKTLLYSRPLSFEDLTPLFKLFERDSKFPIK